KISCFCSAVSLSKGGGAGTKAGFAALKKKRWKQKFGILWLYQMVNN
ncbi:12443_t:CDS:2, partial [Cetraspora pellucida]